MNNKKIAVLALAVAAIIIASTAAVSAFELFGVDILGGPTTDFDNKFMSGTFNGDLTQNKIDDNTSAKGWSAYSCPYHFALRTYTPSPDS